MKFAATLALFYRLSANARAPERTLLDRVYFRLMRPLFQRQVRLQGGYIDPWVRIGPGAWFQHEFYGVFITNRAVIGARAHFMHHVTIGASFTKEGRIKAAPVIGDDVFIGAGANIIGKCVIGDGAKIGAGVTLVDAVVPPGATVINKSAYNLTEGKFVHPQD